ncbi:MULTISPECIES: hypothetical protein [unclassified Arthrobacter]|uniref:hypothetical protein n=1 Tax=unclassified Arthrobacter TaxID=235627 RepID=UPI001E64B23D|nr:MULTISPECIES: hypothetical protein [unclassified Arthrobacter]MCC9145613.1 hypothetical protein [Arthrobacter sp. zg-Y919]MDK1276842.1 hypothetical protein [Arthrobacter sp. zg.Y919]WIB04220.1 hypothetical protein QNO10_06115 [Arthrobacter sp. zg-Y919]
MRGTRGFGAAAALVLLLSGCTAAGPEDEGSQSAPGGDGLSSFASVDDAYDAVAAVLDCDPATTAEPVTIEIDGHLPAYRMCTEAVEVIHYENEADRSKASDLVHGAESGPPYFAEGSNWQVLVLPGREGQVPDPDEITALARELGGRYVRMSG